MLANISAMTEDIDTLAADGIAVEAIASSIKTCLRNLLSSLMAAC